MNTSNLILQVREKLFEMQETVITDGMILKNLNEAYRIAYDVFSKGNASYVAEYRELKISAGTNKYPIPRDIYNKRIVSVDVSYPNGRDERFGLEKINWDKMKNYLSDHTFYHSYPVAWTTLRNDIYVYPSYSTSLWITVIPDMEKLGLMAGKVVSYSDDEIQLSSITKHIDKLPDYENIVTVSDFKTGQVKHTLYVEEVKGETLVLGKHPSRETYEDQPITNIEKVTFDYCEYDYSTHEVTLYGSFRNLSKGDRIQIDFIPELYNEYLTEQAVDLDLDLADNLTKGNGQSPADAVFNKNPFSERFYTVYEVNGDRIKILDSEFTPLVIDGKVFSDHSATVSSSSDCYFIPSEDVEITGTFPGALTAGSNYTLTFSSSGTLLDFTTMATWDGTKFISSYLIPHTDTDVYDQVSYIDNSSNPQTASPTYPDNEGSVDVILSSSHDWGDAGEKVRLSFSAKYDLSATAKQYVEATIVSPTRVRISKPVKPVLGSVVPTSLPFGTGIPRLVEYNLSLQGVELCDLLKNTPDLLDTETEPIRSDDLVTLGYSVGTTVLSDNVEDFMVNYSVATMRGNLNEFDRDVQKRIDLLLRQLHTDIGSRELDVRIKRETPRYRSAASVCRGVR